MQGSREIVVVACVNFELLKLLSRFNSLLGLDALCRLM